MLQVKPCDFKWFTRPLEYTLYATGVYGKGALGSTSISRVVTQEYTGDQSV